jgi:putative tricarboxylic transport membrane protein
MASNDTQPGGDSDRPVVGNNTVDIVVFLILIGLALLMGWDSFRTGNKWASDGPQAGYFPFYLSVLMGSAALYGLISTAVSAISARGEVFVTRDQFTRVMQVFVPTLAFCILTQFIGLYVSSFLLTAGFMWWIGKIRVWVSVLTSLIFSVAMFVTFEIAFNVIMPKGPLETWLGY